MEVVHYTDLDGQDLIDKWLHTLRDKKAVARIVTRIDRLELGLFGDCKYLKGGVSEIRIGYGPAIEYILRRLVFQAYCSSVVATKALRKKISK